MAPVSSPVQAVSTGVDATAARTTEQYRELLQRRSAAAW